MPQAFREFAARFTGSGDLYQNDTRRPTASVNFVTAHDGFTLLDLVSYEHKHNQANGEDNRDGDDHNRSQNCGVEGPSDDPDVRGCRDRQRRNFLTTLFLSQGVPMLLGGDELGRTQGGNNNAYCQDNEVSWIDWGRTDEALLDFTRRLIRLRKDHPVLRRRRWFHGRSLREAPDIAWLRPDGEEMSEQDWTSAELLALGVFLNGKEIPTPDERGRRVVDDSLPGAVQRQRGEDGVARPERALRAALAGGGGLGHRVRQPRTRCRGGRGHSAAGRRAHGGGAPARGRSVTGGTPRLHRWLRRGQVGAL